MQNKNTIKISIKLSTFKTKFVLPTKRSRQTDVFIMSKNVFISKLTR